MASKEIYICDRCQSYIDNKAKAATLSIYLEYIPSDRLVGEAEARMRLVCLSCADHIYRELSLDLSKMDHLFDGKSAPTTDSPIA